MATVVLLQHRKDPDRFPPLRLTLTGATLATDVDGGGSKIQSLPSREVAQEHLERVLRLRRDEGYRILERGELAGDEVEPIDDPIAHLIRYHEPRRRVLIGFEEAPIEADALAEVVARLAAAAAPRCIDLLRTDDRIPGGLLTAALAGTSLPSVKDLVLSANPIFDNGGTSLDDLADWFAVLPNLQRVDASGKVTLRVARHPAVSELHLHDAPRFAEVVAALGSGSLPALATLDLSVREDHDLDRALAAALRSLAAPRLRTVQLAGLMDLTRFLAGLTVEPLPPSWTTLHARGSIGDEDDLLAVLQQRAATLASLGELGLPLADALSEGGVAEAKRLVPQLVDVSGLPAFWAPDASEAW
jgi:hypothetical protein